MLGVFTLPITPTHARTCPTAYPLPPIHAPLLKPNPSQQIGGNIALALLLTVSTNMLGVFTLPFLLPALLGPGLGAVVIEPLPLLVKLVKSILVPTLIGASIRAFVPGEGWLWVLV